MDETKKIGKEDNVIKFPGIRNKAPREGDKTAPAEKSAAQTSDPDEAASTALRLVKLGQAAAAGSKKTSEARFRNSQRKLERDAAAKRGEAGAKYKQTDAGKVRDVWTEELRRAFPDTPIAKGWTKPEYAMAKQVLDLYDLDTVVMTARYLIRNWSVIRKTWKNGAPLLPNLKTLIASHQIYVASAVKWDQFRPAVEAYEAYGDKWAVRPKDVEVQYLAAVKELKALGLK